MMFYKAAGKDYMDDTVHCDEVNWIEQDLIKTLQFIMCRGSSEYWLLLLFVVLLLLLLAVVVVCCVVAVCCC